MVNEKPGVDRSSLTFSKLNNVHRAHLAMLLFALLVSTSFTVGAAIADALDPVALTFLRFLVAAAIFGFLISLRETWRLPGMRDFARYGTIGLTLVVFFVTMFEALRLSSSVSLSAVFTLIPLMTALVSRLMLRQRPGPVLMAGLMVAALGAIWVVFDGSLSNVLGFSVDRGEIIFFVGCISYSIYSPAVRKLHRSESIMTLTFWTIVASAVILAVYGFNVIISTRWDLVPGYVYAGIVYLGIAPTAVSFFMIKFASMHLPAAKVMAYTYLIPALVVAQLAILGEQWPPLTIMVGIGVIAIAMLVLQRATATDLNAASVPEEIRSEAFPGHR